MKTAAIRRPVTDFARAAIFATLVATVAGCGDDGIMTGPQLDQLERAQSLWTTTHGTGPYTMDQRRLCECVRTELYRLTIVDEKVVAAVNIATSQALPANELLYFQSVAQLFQRIRAALLANGKVSVTYDAGAGYPVNASFDPLPQAIDDEITYSTSNVQTRLD